MRVPLSWLREYIELPTSDVGEIAHAFDMLGHGVEDVLHLGVGWTDVRIGRVERIEAHPDADQVRITHVDLGDGALHQIICGAWNFDAGAVVPVAVPGAVLPGGLEIGERKIRGVMSRGMICSERELGIGDVHEGIMVLGDDVAAGGLGSPLAEVIDLPDVVFDLEVTNNRPDAMGMVGVARELAAWFEVPYRWPTIALEATGGPPTTQVLISAPDGCNRFVARELRGLTVGPSPLWMRERLRRAGVRAISNVVDVTNYVMLELGHPLHAFDVDQIAGNMLDVRWAEEGEAIVTLDGVTRSLTPRDLVIVDADGPTSLAAVMGGARSEVEPVTVNVLMEAASWNPATVMYTSRRHDLRSEASARFERGVDPNLAPDANTRASALLAEIGGGAEVSDLIDVVANEVTPWDITLPIREVQRLLDDRFTVEASAAALRRLELEVEVEGDTLRVVVPTFRPDLTRGADLIEELARLADYDSFAATVPTGPVGGLTAEQRRTRHLQDVLRGLGLHQVINLPFVSHGELAAFAEGQVEGVVSVRNPLRDDQAKLRQSLLPGLVRNARDNFNRGADQVAVFEIGRTFHARPWGEDPRVPDQPVRVGVLVAGRFGNERIGRHRTDADAATALGIVGALGEAMGVVIERRQATPAGFHPTRAAQLTIDGRRVGIAGELHPEMAARFDIEGRAGVVELEVAPLVAERPPHQMTAISGYPHSDYDLSFDLPAGVTADRLVAVTSGASDLVEEARVFDEYRPAGPTRSLAITYRLRAADRTLASDEIEAARQAMIQAAGGLGATLRGSANKEDE